jgi:hypothetical protein
MFLVGSYLRVACMACFGPAAPLRHAELLQQLKTRIRGAQVRAALAVNRELVLLYWSIGRDILQGQNAEGWGSKVIDRIAHDLQNEFPGWKASVPARSSTCGRLLLPGRTSQLCSRLLHNCPGATTWSFWTRPRMPRSVYGISALPSSMAGAATSWST